MLLARRPGASYAKPARVPNSLDLRRAAGAGPISTRGDARPYRGRMRDKIVLLVIGSALGWITPELGMAIKVLARRIWTRIHRPTPPPHGNTAAPGGLIDHGGIRSAPPIIGTIDPW